MTNEQLATLIGTGEADELIPLLWEKVHKLYRKMAADYYTRHSERCRLNGVTVDDLRQEGFLAMRDSIRAFNSRAPEQKELAFTSFCGLHFQNHAASCIGIRTKEQRNEPLNTYRTELDAPVQSDSGDTTGEAALVDLVPDTTAEQPFRDIDDNDFGRAVREAVDEALNDEPVGHSIIEKRFYEDKTFAEVGVELNLSSARIQQIQTKVLRKLRDNATIQALAGKTDYYRHISTQACQRDGSLVEQIVERNDEYVHRKAVSAYIRLFSRLSDETLKKDVEMLSDFPETSRTGMQEMIEALNVVTRRRGLETMPARDNGNWW